ncbi:hypothetical protein GCM10028773_37410 [Spirosoma koreense]
MGLLATSVTLNAQSYGLRFRGQEEIQDNRTSLTLSPEKPFCFRGQVEIAFDVSLAPNYETYFGYIFRIIQDEGQNLDLLYDQKTRRFKLIIGERFSAATISLDSTQLFYRWTRFRVQIDLTQQKLQVYANNKLVVQDKVPFTERGCFNIFFGGNDFKTFKSKDLPPMNLKDVELSENGERKYYWPLNEVNGLTATDQLHGQIASVKNPVWIQALHTDWKLAEQFTVKGNASVAFDPTTERLYIVGTEALYRYSVRNRQQEALPQKNVLPNGLPGNQAVYNPGLHRLYNVYVDQKAVAVYDTDSHRWKKESLRPKYTIATEYWQANKFVAGFDSALYMLGGYGQLTYKNRIHRYHFRTQTWDSLPTKGTLFSPRYLAALGTTASADTAYILGGYGSLTGEQMLNPKSSYDLLRYEARTNTFTKLYELPVPKTDFAFGNSLVIDTKANRFYGLIFPNQQFRSRLQLIRGSLSKPSYELLGSVIPYQFHDTHAYADLYFCPASHQLLAVTLYRNEKAATTDVKLYTISFPPNVITSPNAPQTQPDRRYWLWALVAFFVAFLALLYVRRWRSRPQEPVLPLEPASRQSPLDPPVTALVQPEPASPVTPRSRVYLFGNFQVVDGAGADITRAFTPLLKELFLVLTLNSIGKQRGVPSEKLNEILWPDKSGRDAGNNRSVNITKLRSILEKLGPCSLSKDSGYWKITFDFDPIYVDYERYITIISHKAVLSKQAIAELGDITGRGSFLANTEYPWLDDFKGDISNTLINTFLQFAHQMDIGQDPEFLIQITSFIFDYDPVNEEAIMLRCRALVLMGKHTLAKNAFEKFVRDYKNLYGEDYRQPFSAILD